MSGPTAWRYQRGNHASRSLMMSMTIPNNQPYTRLKIVLFHFFSKFKCQAAASLVSGSNLQLQAEAESILTVFFKNSGVAFNKSDCSLMKPIINLSLTRNEKFSIFQTVLERFIPKNLKDSAVYDLARLLLLYHDPQLCNHLDSLKIGFQHFSLSWFSSLMAEDCEVEVTAQLWDLYLVNQDPWIIFFMVTVMLVNFRDNIIEVVDDREELLARLRRLPSQIEADDIPDLVTLAQVLYEDYLSNV